ncbi:MAG: F0F1 ATP synthase subunit delta [Spirochaetaceae bacterium]|jgi:F-type H+-transporting ATPase subunit delta|nr:F0F1 ATP synthase subunit delta [Spirochaetaceae bacterium]
MKFLPARWANAFLIAAGGSSEAGIVVLKSFAAAITGKQKYISGKTEAQNALNFLDKALSAVSFSEEDNQGIRSAKVILFFLISRGRLIFLENVIAAIEHEVHIRSRIIEARIDSAVNPDPEFLEKLEKTIKTKSGADGVNFLINEMPELLGGYRITIGSERQDFSLLRRLHQLETKLSGGTVISS